jgi:hypothetical protein
LADTVAITAGAGTTIATDDIGGVHHQRVKLSLGADGTAVDAGAGAGAVGTDTQRVTLASDDPAVAGIGGVADAAATAGSTGSLAAKIRLLTSQLDAVKTSVEIVDDWDEADRLKVNLIAGQAGIAAGAGSSGATVPRVTLASDSPAPVASYGGGVVSLTRTNDTNAYGANDILGAATGSTAALTFASMGPSAGAIIIVGASLEVDSSALISGETEYRLHLYNITPSSALGDNAAFDLPSGDRDAYLGYIDFGTPVDLGSTLYVKRSGLLMPIKLAGTSLFGYLVTIGAYTPTASRVYRVALQAIAP